MIKHVALLHLRIAEEALKLEMPSPSGQLCASEARELYSEGEYTLSLAKSLRSLEHSLGIFHFNARACAVDLYNLTDHPLRSQIGQRYSL